MKRLNDYLKMAIISGGLVLFVAANSTAAIHTDSVTLTPQLGMMIFEGNQDLDTGLTGGLSLGYNFNDNWGVESVLTLTSAGQKNGGDDVNITAGHLDLLYHFLPKERLVPYVSLALGAIQLEDDEDLLAGYGVGVKYFLSEDLALRFDLKHLLDINYRDVQRTQEVYNTLVATGGLSFQFGNGIKGQSVSDGDADGVIDSCDQCPDTLSGVSVDSSGCPLIAPKILLDSDRDGVTDNLDLCPNSESGVTVDKKGCPIPAPISVPAVVELPEPSLTLYLEYPTNESDVTSAFSADMQQMADFVKANPGRRFIIEGHTDSVGNNADNMKLSLLRAEKISDYLTGKMGIPAAMLEARGFGEGTPVADNNTQEGRQLNRRVVIIAIPQ